MIRTFHWGTCWMKGGKKLVPPSLPKKKLEDYPAIEGDETLTEYIGQYKRACLNKKAMLKTTKERLEKDNVNVAEYKLLGCKKCSL